MKRRVSQAWMSATRRFLSEDAPEAVRDIFETNFFGPRKELQGQETQVLALHVGYIDTDMASHASGPKVKPEDVVRTTLDALEAGKDEVFADDLSKRVKQGLSAERGAYLG